VCVRERERERASERESAFACACDLGAKGPWGQAQADHLHEFVQKLKSVP
jgi:hypothetical protein